MRTPMLHKRNWNWSLIVRKKNVHCKSRKLYFPEHEHKISNHPSAEFSFGRWHNETPLEKHSSKLWKILPFSLLKWMSVVKNGGLLWKRFWTCAFPERLEISWQTKRLSASQLRRYSADVVRYTSKCTYMNFILRK